MKNYRNRFLITIILMSFLSLQLVCTGAADETEYIDMIPIGSEEYHPDSWNEVEEPVLMEHASVYAEIPELDIVYAVRPDDVKFGASSSKIFYCYYAYCVMDWGDVPMTAYWNQTLKDCCEGAIKDSNNDQAVEVFKYIFIDPSRRAGFMKWLEEALQSEVPVITDGYKYRIGYDSLEAFCPFVSARENESYWKQIWKDFQDGSELKDEKRYQDFLNWAYHKCVNNPDIGAEYHKGGWIYSGAELSVHADGGVYRLTLNDGNTYDLFISYLEDCCDMNDVYEIINGITEYMEYLGNKKLVEPGNITDEE